MKILTFSSFFMLFFLVAAFAMAVVAMPSALGSVETLSLRTLLNGKWTPEFEKNFTEKLAVYAPSRVAWGTAEYEGFQDGRSGVVVGKDGWFFTAEEFQTSRKDKAVYDEHLTYISETAKALKDKNIRLVVALLPAKARAHSEFLGDNAFPAIKEPIYKDTLDALKDRGVATVNLLPVLSASKGSFLKTDTHWTPSGAALAAETIAAQIKWSCADCGLGDGKFMRVEGEEKIHDGDLLRYVPVSEKAKAALMQDRISAVTTEAEAPAAGDSGGEDSLFGDKSFSVVLVGTSYSANPAFNFDGFLKEYLGTDVLNAADEGQGPFVTMKAWQETLEKNETTAPRLVIWEIPERYLTIADKKQIE